MVKIAKHISVIRLEWLRDAGLTIPEIARALQVSPNRVQSLISKELGGMRKGNAEKRLRAYETHFPVETETGTIVGTDIEGLARDHQAKLEKLERYQELLPDTENADSEISDEEYIEALQETFRRLNRRRKKEAKRHRQRQKGK